MDDRYIELVNKAISAEANPDEKAELEKYLESDPEARKIYRQLIRTSELLGEAGDVEPSAYLKTLIINSVDFSRYEAKQKGPVLEFLSRAGRFSLRPRFAYGFALGVAVGLVVVSVFVTGPGGRYRGDIRDLYGTIGITEDAGFISVERVPISSGQVTGLVDLLRLGDSFMFEVTLRGLQASEVLLSYDPDQAVFRGITPHDSGKTVLDVGSGYVKTTGYGDGDLSLHFLKEKASTASLDLRILSSGELLVSHKFTVGPESEPR